MQVHKKSTTMHVVLWKKIFSIQRLLPDVFLVVQDENLIVLKQTSTGKITTLLHQETQMR